ncbi:MFS transporter [Gleimia sp. 6138-11-ORH1]|uniref:MFS transporter n=1 Tax=Gleimia sp. 6138-11-ORH1 TaxID=2973937 RepID=UPI00216A4975|nr:MFS transporter [Gleimia sp. 6138-11-ORH1]MCS4485030.1 MFS transporter [Gleimia sp. 6138-11-ORH1]
MSAVINTDKNSQKEPKKGKLLNKTILSWAIWDWGSAAFNAVATTFVFSTYLVSSLFGDPSESSIKLSWGLTIAGIIIALTAPISGQRADRKGKGTFWLGANSLVVFAALLGMFFVRPGSTFGMQGALWLGIILLSAGNIFFEFASVNYNAMLGRISTPENMGRVSGIGWAAGYLGGIVLLFLLLILFLGDNPLFPFPKDDGMHVRAAMVIAAFWFGLSALPVIFAIPGRKLEGHEEEAPETIVESYRHLVKTVKRLYKEAPHTLFFLFASAIFRDGLAGVFTYGAILAKVTFAFSDSEIILFAVASNVVAAAVTIIFGWVDDGIGPKKTIMISLFVMICMGLIVFFFHSEGKTVFWIAGLTLAGFVGPAQSASRSFLGRVIPEGREGEVFGLYATTGRAVSFLAPAMYGLFVTIGLNYVSPGQQSAHFGILGIISILLVGMLMLIPVKEKHAHLNSFDGK